MQAACDFPWKVKSSKTAAPTADHVARENIVGAYNM
jgi:hypothetical protein